jgi:hypothetical protein
MPGLIRSVRDQPRSPHGDDDSRRGEPRGQLSLEFFKSRGTRRAAAALAVAASGIAAGAGAAFASNTGWKPVTAQSVSGEAAFAGSYVWYSRQDNNGGFRIKGTLSDLNKKNSRGVKFQVQVEAYSPSVFNAPTDKDKAIPDLVHFAPDETITHVGSIQTCQVNYLADDCSSWRRYTNPYV